MSQIFHPSFNVIAKASLVAALLLGMGIIWILLEFERSPYLSDAGVFINQPVPFSHEHHVRGLGLDCRYCHTSVETSPYAGMPPIKTCMTCHSKIWTSAPVLEPVRQAWQNDRPITWKRVNNLPPYVYFAHSPHVQKGIGCSTCHGQVERMPLMLAVGSLQMGWCLTCHREPERFLRPRQQIFNMSYVPPMDQIEQGRELAKQHDILPPKLMEDCSLCHR